VGKPGNSDKRSKLQQQIFSFFLYPVMKENLYNITWYLILNSVATRYVLILLQVERIAASMIAKAKIKVELSQTEQK
jgi:hypothetical protein